MPPRPASRIHFSHISRLISLTSRAVESGTAHESIESLDARRHHAVHLSIGDILKQVVLPRTAPIIDDASDFAGTPDDDLLPNRSARMSTCLIPFNTAGSWSRVLRPPPCLRERIREKRPSR